MDFRNVVPEIGTVPAVSSCVSRQSLCAGNVARPTRILQLVNPLADMVSHTAKVIPMVGLTEVKDSVVAGKPVTGIVANVGL